MAHSFERELEVARQVATKAGHIMRRYFDADQELIIKNDGTPLTIADTTINRLVIEELSREFPDDIVVGEEESTGSYGMGRRWLCDPIDGTKAFTWGVPTAMFSLALVVDGVPTVGVGYEPIRDKLYWAVRGHGAFLGDKQLRVNQEDLDGGLFATISSPERIKESTFMTALIARNQRMAVFSGAVAKSVGVAEGRFVGYMEEMVNPYDMAAVEVIVREAGGAISDLEGRDLDYINGFRGAIVSNGRTHDELVALVASSR